MPSVLQCVSIPIQGGTNKVNIHLLCVNQAGDMCGGVGRGAGPCFRGTATCYCVPAGKTTFCSFAGRQGLHGGSMLVLCTCLPKWAFFMYV